MEIGQLNEADAQVLRGGKCPVCGSERFWDGPHGGMAANIFCENGHRFWVSWPFTPEYQGQTKVEIVDRVVYSDEQMRSYVSSAQSTTDLSSLAASARVVAFKPSG